MIRVLLVDDETLAVDRLRGLLAHFDDVEVVGSAHSGDAALEQAAALRPDAILLDVEMPILDGFDVVEELARGGAEPLIIFVTAFPRFAASAFDTGAIDFLTKPVRLTRLEAAVARLRRAIDDRTATDRLCELAGQLEALRQERGGAGIHAPNHLWVRCRGEAVRVDLDRLECIAAEGEYVRLFTGEASYLHRASVTAMMERLNPQRFLRIHRSYIIDRNRIVSVRRRATGGYELLTDGGRTLPVGRNYRAGVRDILADRKRA
jgi:DNA-binding LytR/AlgR family response regulator